MVDLSVARQPAVLTLTFGKWQAAHALRALRYMALLVAIGVTTVLHGPNLNGGEALAIVLQAMLWTIYPPS